MTQDDKNGPDEGAVTESVAANAGVGMAGAPAPEATVQSAAPAAAPNPAPGWYARRTGLLPGIAIGIAGTLIVLGGVRVTLGLAHGLIGRGAWDGRGPAWQRSYDGGGAADFRQRGCDDRWGGSPRGGGFGQGMRGGPGAGARQGIGGRGMRGPGWGGQAPSQDGTVTAP